MLKKSVEIMVEFEPKNVNESNSSEQGQCLELRTTVQVSVVEEFLFCTINFNFLNFRVEKHQNKLP